MSAAAQGFLLGEEATLELGRRMARRVQGGGLVFLSGELGTGKTTLVRGLLWALGHHGAVRSPTFTLVEPYMELQPPVYHLDLYRLASPEELELIGLRDYLAPGNLCLVEWPERGKGVVERPDLQVTLYHGGAGRRVVLEPITEAGAAMVPDSLPTQL